MALSSLPAQSQADQIDTINLARALTRLEAKVLSPDPHSPLRYSIYERSKTAANLEYARTLLLRLEHSASAIKTQARKHTAQERLLRQRNLIKKLNDRLFELGQLDDGNGGSDVSDDEDVLALIEGEPPTVPPTPAAPPVQVSSADKSSPNRSVLALTTEPASAFRARKALFGSAASSINATGSTTAHTLHPTSTSTPQQNSTTQLLESQDSLQTNLTSDLLTLASQLKSSAQAFSTDLASDAATVSQTETALGKNKAGMDAATARMGVLRRMSEGRWWWGRMMLYAAIAALWVVAILLVFVGPKLRF